MIHTLTESGQLLLISEISCMWSWVLHVVQRRVVVGSAKNAFCTTRMVQHWASAGHHHTLVQIFMFAVVAINATYD